jgi:membrane-associated protein
MHIFQEMITNLGALAGLLIFGAIIFAETGILLGAVLPLPGDSLLVFMGVLAAQGKLSIIALLAVGTIAAITGDSFGYYIGKKLGPALADKKIGKYSLDKGIKKTELFYKAYGTKTLIIARFIPVARTLAPVLAGVAQMPYRTFISYNVIGGVAWIWSVTLLGYFIGNIPGIDRYVLGIVVGIIIISLLPVIREIRKGRKS